MTFWEDENFWKNVMTVGAHGRIVEKEDTFRARLNELRRLMARIESRRAEARRTMENLVAAKTSALGNLERITIISKNVSIKRRLLGASELPSGPPAPDMASIERTLRAAKEHDLLQGGARAGGAGVASVAGAWMLVGSIGVASTGTGIATLSGAAATSATLAWFGGGAMAAGGGGIAAGTAVLGGLVAVPALIIYGIFSHAEAEKKLRQIAEKEADLVKNIAEANRVLLSMDTIEARSREIELVLRKQEETFVAELHEMLSRFFTSSAKVGQFFRKLVTGSGFLKEEVEQIGHVISLAAAMVKSIDQAIMDADGNPV